MKKEFTYNDVPLEVFEVWAIQITGQPVGLSTWNRCNEIVNKYPEWFPEKTNSKTKNTMIPIPNLELVLIIPEKIEEKMNLGGKEFEKSETQKENEKRAQTRGTVFAVGDKVEFFKKGDLVSVYRAAVTEITEDGIEYFSINQQNILCKFVSNVQG